MLKKLNYKGIQMYIKKISIKNFRVFDNIGVEVIFKQGVNAIIGENNSGKSALIDAIRIAFSAVTYKKDIYFNKSDFHINIHGKRENTAQIDIYLENVPKYLIEIWNPEDPSTGEFHLLFYIDVNPSGIEKVKYKAWGGKIEGNTLSVDTFDAMNIAFLGALRNAENELKPSRTSKLANLLTTIITDDDKRIELVKELQKANNVILNMEPIKRTKEIINTNLLDIEQDLLSQQIDVGLVEPSFESITASLRSWIVPRWCLIDNNNNLYNKIIAINKDKHYSKYINDCENGIYIDINGFLHSNAVLSDSEKTEILSLMNYTFELKQNGLGYNNLLFMSTVLGDMSLDKKGIFLNLFTIEEPEAHLHPQLQELLHNFFEKKYKKSTSIQVIYTSHSPTLVSKIGIDATNLLYKENHTSRCYPLANAQLDEKEKNYLEKYLDVTKSQIFFAKGIIFVEGISEALLLPQMAKILQRPLDKYAIEIVNVDGTSFNPFVKILTLPSSQKSFAKASIITDDDRCSNKKDEDTYISKDLDFDCDLTGLSIKINNGNQSDRFNKIKNLCSKLDINVFGAVKTFEYELAIEKNNIPYILDAIKSVFPQVGQSLCQRVDSETNNMNKALMIWLFIRARDKNKGEIAQSLSRIIQKQIDDLENGIKIDNPFIVPNYIAHAIYAVTESEEKNHNVN